MDTNKNRAIDMFTDFLNMAFLLILIGFVIFFIIVGDRVDTAQEIIRSIVPFSLFGIVFLIAFKVKRRELKKEKDQFTLDNIVVYLSPKDGIKDKVVISFLPVSMLLLNLVDKDINNIDIMQALIVLIYMIVWHYMKMNSIIHNITQPGYTRQDIIKDEIALFALPLVSLIVPIIHLRINIIDMLQAVAPLLIMYLWRKFLFHTHK